MCSSELGSNEYGWKSPTAADGLTKWRRSQVMGGGLSSRQSRPASAAPNKKDRATGTLGATLTRAGIKKVVMIRHANAAPRNPEAAAAEDGAHVLKPDTPFANAWTVGDLTRELTEKGSAQAVAARAWLETHEVRAVIASEALRATATLDIMTSGKFTKGGAGYLTLHTLHPSRSGTPDCEKMWATSGRFTPPTMQLSP